MSKVIRISHDNYEKLNELETATGSSKQDLIEQALEKLFREFFLAEVNKDYEALRNNPEAWKEELAERAEWESINDKLEDF